MEKGVTGVLIIHNDASLLDKTLHTVNEYIDRLLIVDGAYEWVAPFCALQHENPEKSTDNLLDIVNESGIPYEYYSGTWMSETEKRMFSLEKAKTKFVMSIDSDELFEINDAALDRFYSSDKVFGECYFPLYFSKNIIGESTGLGTSPVKPIFINKAVATARQIVDTMFLLVPDDERARRMSNEVRFDEKVGVAHHVSLFRKGGGSYRRARFYNLLSMRINKRLILDDDGTFETDAQFFEKMSSLSMDKLKALDSLFKFHRISAAFPSIKENQALVRSPGIERNIDAMICESFESMLDDQYQRIMDIMGQKLTVFSNRAMYFDVTRLLSRAEQCLNIGSHDAQGFDVMLYKDKGLEREPIPIFTDKVDVGEWSISLPASCVTDIRMVLEVIPRGNNSIVDFSITDSSCNSRGDVGRR